MSAITTGHRTTNLYPVNAKSSKKAGFPKLKNQKRPFWQAASNTHKNSDLEYTYVKCSISNLNHISWRVYLRVIFTHFASSQ